MSRLPHLILLIHTHHLKPLLLPEPNRPCQERVRVQVHALHAGFLCVRLQSRKERGSEAVAAVGREDEQTDDFDCFEGG